MYFKNEVDRLVEAALDQPNPTPALKEALNALLKRAQHPAALKS